MQNFIRCGIGFLVILLLSGSASAHTLTDIKGTPNETAILFLQSRGAIGGYANGTFLPDTAVNRAEFLKILVLATGNKPIDADAHHCFPDVSDEWFASSVCHAKKQGWVKGFEDGTFKPEQTVTLPEALKMTMSAFGYLPMESSSAPPLAGVDPTAWYAPYVQLALEQNIFQFTDTFNPLQKMSRAGVSDMIYRGILKQQADTGHTTTPTSVSSSSLSSSVASPSRRRGGGGSGIGGSDGGNTGGDSSSSHQSSLSAPSITFGSISKNYGDADFALSPTSDSNGSFTYVSSDTAVATISGNTVSITGVGTTVITATQAAAGSYASATKTATLTVSAIAPTITFNNISKTYGDASFTLAPTSNSAGAFTFVSSNTNVATIAGSTVTIVGAGTATITGTQAANGNYTSGSAAPTLTVAKATPVIASISDISIQSRDYSGVCLVDPDAFIASCDDMGYLMFDLPSSTSTADFTSLTASNGTVIDVSNSAFDYAGFLNIVGEFRYGFVFDNGAAAFPDPLTTTATLHQAANANFNAGSTTFTITIEPTNLDSEDNFFCLNWGVYLRKSTGGECLCQSDFGGDQCDEFIGV